MGRFPRLTLVHRQTRWHWLPTPGAGDTFYRILQVCFDHDGDEWWSGFHCFYYCGYFSYLVGLVWTWDSYGLVSCIFQAKPYSSSALASLLPLQIHAPSVKISISLCLVFALVVGVLLASTGAIFLESVKTWKHSARLFWHVIAGSKRIFLFSCFAVSFLSFCVLVRERLSCGFCGWSGFILGCIWLTFSGLLPRRCEGRCIQLFCPLYSLGISMIGLGDGRLASFGLLFCWRFLVGQPTLKIIVWIDVTRSRWVT